MQRSVVVSTRRLTQFCGRTSARSNQSRSLSLKASLPQQFAMKPGTVIPGLDIFKDKEPPVALARSEYPEWVGHLAKGLPTLADLRRMPEEDATEKEMMRYLKLERRIVIKENNQVLKES